MTEPVILPVTLHQVKALDLTGATQLGNMSVEERQFYKQVAITSWPEVLD